MNITGKFDIGRNFFNMFMKGSDKLNYTRFVIVGQERTGSTLLQMLLFSHDNVLSLGELFNSREEIRKKGARLIERPLQLDDDPIEFLKNYVYVDYPNHIKAVGFKLFYSHARNDKWKSLWSYIRDSRVKIIHIKRRNFLERFLSHQLAYRSDLWIATHGVQNEYNQSITLSIKDCCKDFYETQWYEENTDDFFKDSPKLDVIYEDLSNDLAGEGVKIQHFLELEIQDLSSITQKQRVKQKSEIITNYEALKQEFSMGVTKGWAKKEWLDFFDE